MLRVVIDTNVAVSALMSPAGNSAKVLDFVANRELRICYSLEILAEYSDVLARPHFDFEFEDRDNFIQGLKKFGLLVKPDVSDAQIPDEYDLCFYDAEKSCEAILATGNAKHYPSEPFIVSPQEFLNLAQRMRLFEGSLR